MALDLKTADFRTGRRLLKGMRTTKDERNGLAPLSRQDHPSLFSHAVALTAESLHFGSMVDDINLPRDCSGLLSLQSGHVN